MQRTSNMKKISFTSTFLLFAVLCGPFLFPAVVNASPFQKAKALKQNLFDMADKPNMRSLTFKIVFKDELGDNRTAYYDAAERELSLSKRLKFSKDLRQAVTKTPILNQALCDNIYRKLNF